MVLSNQEQSWITSQLNNWEAWWAHHVVKQFNIAEEINILHSIIEGNYMRIDNEDHDVKIALFKILTLLKTIDIDINKDNPENIDTVWSKATVKNDFSLANPKNKNKGQTQSFL